MTKEPFVVYSQYTILESTRINAYSNREASIIIKQRMKRKNYFEPKVIKVVSYAEDQAIHGSRDNPARVVKG